MRALKALSCMLVLAVLPSCDSSGPPIFQVSGHYEGSLTDHSDGKTYRQTPVCTDISSEPTTAPAIVVMDGSGTAKLTLQISNVTDTGLTVQSTPGMVQPMDLTLDSSSQCYLGSVGVKVTLCVTQPEITLEVQNPYDNSDLMSLVLYQFKTGDAAQVQETPQAYTLTGAITRARTMSFASRIEFEHVVQAKLAAQAAYLHLLPQITMSTIANSISPAPLSFVGTFQTALQSIGDLAPFLLPSRWLQAAATEQQSKAEQDSEILMRLDTGVQVEGLFYAYARDKKTRELTQAFLAQLIDPNTGIRHEVKVREDLGQLPVGSTLTIDSIINQTQQNLSVLNQVTSEDLSSISQTLGYFNPTTVTDAAIDTELVPIATAKPIDFNTVNSAALNRSYELDQMDYLINAANETKTAKYFEWLDPAGDPNLGLGAALPVNIELSQSQIQELNIDKQQLQSILSQKVFNAVTDYSQALDNYRGAQDGLAIQTNLLATEMANLKTGVNVDLFGLVSILQNYLAAQIMIESSNANYRVARSEVDRLLLEGYYANF